MSVNKWVIGAAALGLMCSSAQAKMWGFQIYPKDSTAYCGEDVQQSIDNMVSMGANVIPLMVEIFQSDFESYDFYADAGTPTDECLHEVSEYITETLGMDVAYFYRPETRAGWRKDIDVDALVENGGLSNGGNATWKRDLWFENYSKFLVRHSRDFAQRYGAKFVVIGTELHDMASDDHDDRNRGKWSSIISSVREVYSGDVTYSAQHADSMEDELSIIFDNNGLIPNLDIIGLSGYYPLYGATDAESALKKLIEWESRVILPMIELYGNKRVLFTEVGYRPQESTFERPYDSWTVEPYDGRAQAEAWEALITFCQSRGWCLGTIGWAWETDPTLGGAGDLTYTPWGKPAGDRIRNMWGGSGDEAVSEPSAPVLESESEPEPEPEQEAQPPVDPVPEPVVDVPMPEQPVQGPLSHGTPGADQKCDMGQEVLYADNYFFNILWSAGEGACWARGEKPSRENYVGFEQGGETSSSQITHADLIVCPWAVTDSNFDGYGWTDRTRVCIVKDVILPSGIIEAEGGLLYDEYTADQSAQTGSGGVGILSLILLGIGGVTTRRK